MVSAIGWLTKCHTKRWSEFENNAIGPLTFVGWPACWLGLLYMYHIHIISVIFTYPVLDLLNKLILIFNDCDNWIDVVYE